MIGKAIEIQKTEFGYLVYHKHSNGGAEFLGMEQTYARAMRLVKEVRNQLVAS